MTTPRVMTEDEVREAFLDSVRGICDYWIREPRATTAKEKVEGVAFSILVLLDGGHGMMPGFLVAAQPHKDDKPFHQAEGSNWYPEEPVDIAGSLHERFHK